MRAPIAILLFVACSCAAADSLDDLAAAIESRLLLMPDVARYKWNRGLPVADPARESTLLEHIDARAHALSIEPDCARVVMEAQLAAARAWQSRLVARWRARSRGPFADVPDLATAQRPAIDAATERLLAALRDIGCTADPTATARLAQPPPALSDQPEVWAIAVAPWLDRRR